MPSVYALFSNYLSEEFFEKAVEFTNQYSVQKTGTSMNASLSEIRCLFAVHIIMGCLKFPRIRMYWSALTKVPMIAEAMNFNRFSSLRNNLHLVDNNAHDENDNNRLWKVQPIVDAVLKRCREHELEKELSVDEQMIPFKGHLNIKQYIKNKPTPWGIKVFVLSGKSGLVHNFLIYQGKTTGLDEEKMKTFGVGAAVVLHLGKVIPQQMNYKLFCDNYFTSVELLKELKSLGIMAAGTINKNRLAGCPLPSEKDMKKKERGSSEEFVRKEGKIVIVGWLDNKLVSLASNYVGIGKPDEVERWDKKEKVYVKVKRPEVIQHYNRGMGGVDKMDMLISLYRIFIRSRKWTLRVIFHFVDLAICNSWLEYLLEAEAHSVPKKDLLDLLAFKMEVGKSLMTVNLGEAKSSKRGRPSLNGSSQERSCAKRRISRRETPVEDARYDNFAHFPEIKSEKSQRCAMPGCKGHTRFQCRKCSVFLCLVRERNCFLTYHTRV